MFDKKLKELRKAKGLTQSDLASKLDVSESAISKWENAVNEPEEDMHEKIAKFFGVSVGDLGLTGMVAKAAVDSKAKDAKKAVDGKVADAKGSAKDVAKDAKGAAKDAKAAAKDSAKDAAKDAKGATKDAKAAADGKANELKRSSKNEAVQIGEEKSPKWLMWILIILVVLLIIWLIVSMLNK